MTENLENNTHPSEEVSYGGTDSSVPPVSGDSGVYQPTFLTGEPTASAAPEAPQFTPGIGANDRQAEKDAAKAAKAQRKAEKKAAKAAKKAGKKVNKGIVVLVIFGLLIGAGLGVGGTMAAKKLPEIFDKAESYVGDSKKDEEPGSMTEVPEAAGIEAAPELEIPEEPEEKPAEPEAPAEVETPAVPNDESPVTAASEAAELSLPDIYEANVGSTVGITTEVTTTNLWGYSTTGAAAGSGFIYSEDGYIITNYHVVEGARSITVTLYNNESYEAILVNGDGTMDIAVLKIDAEGLKPVTIGDSDALRVGETVVAIGNPLGELTFSLTRGIVSALNRDVTLGNGYSMKLIQTDCAINSGNSGGALFNMKGEVVGITNAKYSSSGYEASIDNIGFAIPIDSVLNAVDQIIENGFVSKPYIGVSVTSTDGNVYGLPSGACIQEIAEGSPAEEAGLQLHDIVTKINDTDIASSGDLVDFIATCAPGDVLNVTVYRSGKNLNLKLTVGEKAVTAETEAEAEEGSEEGSAQGFGEGGYEDNYSSYLDGFFSDIFGNYFGDFDDYYGDYYSEYFGH